MAELGIDIQEKQGWSEETLLKLAEAFIVSQYLMADYLRFLQEIADKENEE